MLGIVSCSGICAISDSAPQGCGLVNAKLDEFFWEWHAPKRFHSEAWGSDFLGMRDDGSARSSACEVGRDRSSLCSATCWNLQSRPMRLMQPESMQLLRQIIHNAEDPTAEARIWSHG